MPEVAPNEGTLARPEEWEFHGACAHISEEAKQAFFMHGEDDQRFAKSICNNMCEVKEQCLEWALRQNIRYGVLGGLSEKERSGLRRKMYRQNETRYKQKHQNIEVVSVEKAS